MEQNKIIKVAQVIGKAVDGGTEAFAMNYYRNIDRSKVQFDFLVESTSKTIDIDEIRSLGGNVVIIPSYKNPLKYMNTLKKIFKQNKYDIVHSNMNTLSVFTLRAAQKAGVKIRIAHSHSTSNSKEHIRNFAKLILKHFSKLYATNYFCCSEEAGRWLFGNKLYDAKKVELIYNGINIQKFKFDSLTRKKLRSEYSINDKIVYGHVGRMVSQKNHILLLKIFAEIHKKQKNAVLLLVGDGPLKSEIINLAEKLKISDKIIFAGTHKDVSCFYDMMDCFIFPSLYEGLGMTLIEAQINGLDCFVSSTIPKSAIINTNVLTIDLDSLPEEWALNILNFSNSYQRENGYINFLNSNYDIKICAKHLEELYENMVNEKNEELRNK